MALQTNVSVTRHRNGMTWNLPDPNFGRQLVQRIQEVLQDFIRAFIESVHRQIQRRLVPYLKQNLPKRTGRLQRSVRLRRIHNGFQIESAFYGAFQKPSVRQTVANWVQREYNQILQTAQREALSQVT